MVAHIHVFPILHLGFCLLVRMFQGGGVPPPPTICRGRCRLVNGCWDCSIWGGWCGCIAGWGRRGYGPPTAAPPPYVGAIPPAPTRRGGTPTPNPNKQYNNWNMCYSCGYDLPIWHTSATCDNRKHGHQVGCTRANAEQYTTGGHYVSTKGAHKVNLPVNPDIHQA